MNNINNETPFATYATKEGLMNAATLILNELNNNTSNTKLNAGMEHAAMVLLTQASQETQEPLNEEHDQALTFAAQLGMEQIDNGNTTAASDAILTSLIEIKQKQRDAARSL